MILYIYIYISFIIEQNGDVSPKKKSVCISTRFLANSLNVQDLFHGSHALHGGHF